jgi:uncharacterized delta-60 repeat protein
VRVAVARYETDGSLDTTFGGDGRVVTNFTPGYDYAEDVVLQTDGEIVVVGGAAGAGGRFALVRYETNGALDTTFSGDGRATTNFTPGNDYGWDMALQEDERIVVVGAAAGAGERFALARYTTSGGLDTTFGGDGRVITDLNSGSDVATGVGVQDDGKIVAAGWSGPANSSNYRFAVARYENGGGLDATFGSGGTATTNFTTGNDYAWDMTIQSDGKVVAVGRASGAGGRFALARYTAA